MAAMPLPPASDPVVEASSLSEPTRILNTFIAPRKTFTDLRRNASFWGPLLLMVVFSVAFVYIGGEKVGFKKIMENQMRAQPRQQAQMDSLPADQREQHLEQGAKITRNVSYGFWAIQLIIFAVIAAALFATFKFAAGADITFKVAFAVVMYAGLPGLLRVLLAVLSLVTGASPDSFTFQNPVATNPGYFLNPSDSTFLYSLASSLDIFLIWTLFLTALGFTCVSKVKMGTACAIVFGWWALFSLLGAGLASLG
jgi:tetrahydromethanopterin S-methyltransferase subunit B